MRKITFNSSCAAYLDEPLSAGDIVEVVYNGVTKMVRVTADVNKFTPCSSCALRGKIGDCNLIIYPPSSLETRHGFSPCSYAVICNEPRYKHNYCVHYEDISKILEDL